MKGGTREPRRIDEAPPGQPQEAFQEGIDEEMMANWGGTIYVSQEWLINDFGYVQPDNDKISNMFVHEISHGWGGHSEGHNATGDMGHGPNDEGVPWLPPVLRWFGPEATWTWSP